jgi:hypothetical protein
MKGEKNLALMMSLQGEQILKEKEHDERLRPVWKILIRVGPLIIQGKLDEAKRLIEAEDLRHLITTTRNYEAVATHLKFLLEATGHQDRLQEFSELLKGREA